ncbi:MAG: DUF6600 domain-containing protein [Vulcanimicrobiaceae bacterium]|jgi:uncharacterized membrane protein YgcG
MARLLHSFITALVLIALLIAPAYGGALTGNVVVAAHVSYDGGGIRISENDSAEEGALNAPVFAGDFVRTSTGDAELEIDAATAVRMAPRAQIYVASLDVGRTSLEVDTGTIEIRVFQPRAVTVVTRSSTVEIAEPGSYRIEVLPGVATRVTVRGGRATVPLQIGDALAVASGMSLQVSGTRANPRTDFSVVADVDEFDRWNDARDVAMSAGASDTRVNPILGANELENYGHWLSYKAYGMVWSPNANPGWAPYTVGSWMTSPVFGPVWLSSEPWGWAPYHYGRWINDDEYGWLWIPEQSVVSWEPALVAFIPPYGAPVDAAFCWRPLAPGDIYEPWYNTTVTTFVSNNHTNKNGLHVQPPVHSFVRPGVSFPFNPSIRVPEVHFSGRSSGSGARRSGGGSRSGGGGHSGGGGGGHSGGGHK